MKKKQVIVVESNRAVRDRILRELSSRADIGIVGIYAGCLQLPKPVAAGTDVICLSSQRLELHGHHRIAKWLRQWPKIQVVLLLPSANAGILESALQCDIKGFVLHSNVDREIVDAIRAVTSGNYFASASIFAVIAADCRDESIANGNASHLQSPHSQC